MERDCFLLIFWIFLNTLSSKYALLPKREVKMAGYWPSSFFEFLWTETKNIKNEVSKIKNVSFFGELEENTFMNCSG